MVPRPICKTPHRMDLSSCFPLSLQVTNPRRHLGGQQSSTSKHLGCLSNKKHLGKSNATVCLINKNNSISLHKILERTSPCIATLCYVLPKHLKPRKAYFLEYRDRLFEPHVRKSHSCFSYLGSHGRVGLLQQVPEFLPLFRAAGVIKLFTLAFPHGLRLPPQFFVHLLLLLMIPGLATRL